MRPCDRLALARVIEEQSSLPHRLANSYCRSAYILPIVAATSRLVHDQSQDEEEAQRDENDGEDDKDRDEDDEQRRGRGHQKLGEEDLVTLELDDADISSARDGNGGGPAIVIYLRAHIIITTVRELVLCLGNGKTGGSCEVQTKKRRQRGRTIVDWAFRTDSAAFSAWRAQSTVFDVDNNVLRNMLLKLKQLYKGTMNEEDTYVSLQRWGEVRNALLLGN